jgi:cytochrome c-type biogenesis protein CcmH
VSSTFWLVAGLLCAFAFILLLVPILRYRSRAGTWSPVGLVAAVLVVPAALALYFHVSDWDPEYAAELTRNNAIVDELARRLESTPNDARGLQLLANSYASLQRWPDARAAYERLWALTPQPDDELKLAYAESLLRTDPASLTGEGGRLIEEVLASNPDNPLALWFGGFVAIERARPDVARTRWTRLLAFNPDPEFAATLRARLDELDAATQDEQAPAPIGPEIKVTVTLGEGRTLSALGPNAQLFIIARAPGEEGPPIAVIRRPPTAVPGEFSLSDANSMIAGRSISAYPEITVIARLSRTGQPTAQPGDWEAQALVRPNGGAAVALVIDQVVQ